MAIVPDKINKYIASSDLYQKVDAIGKKYTLDLDGIGELQILVINVFTNEIPDSSLEKSITDTLAIDMEEAVQIATDIRTTIIKPILAEVNKPQDEPANVVPEPTVETQKPIEPAPVPQPVAEIPKPEPISMPIPEAPIAAAHPINIIEEVKKPETKPFIEEHIHENLPAIQEEREVAIRRIITPDPVLNKQLEVPVVRKTEPVHTTPITSTFVPEKPTIEAPKPQPAPVVQAPQPVVATPKPTPVVAPIPNPAPSIIDARLGIKPVSMPKENLDLSNEKKHDGVQYPPRYTKDPYRESIE